MTTIAARIVGLIFGLMLALATTAGSAAESAQTEPDMRSGTIDEIDFARDSVIINDRSYLLPANAVIHQGKRQLSRQSLTRGMRVAFRAQPANNQRSMVSEVWIQQ